MTVVALLADPPRPGLVYPDLADAPVSPAEAADLYRACLRDAARAVVDSGGDLLVNYRPEDLLPDDHEGPPAEAAVRETLADVAEDARYEVQVGSTPSARVGNTLTHLLEEGATSAAALWPSAPLVGRTRLDEAAMKLRRSETVLGPAERGGVYYLGVRDPVDFADALRPPAVGRLVDRTDDAGGETDFLQPSPTVDHRDGLATAVALLRARERAGRPVPPETTARVEDLGLRVADADGDPELVRD